MREHSRLTGQARTYRCDYCQRPGVKPGKRCMTPRCNWRAPDEPAYHLEAQYKRNTKNSPLRDDD